MVYTRKKRAGKKAQESAMVKADKALHLVRRFKAISMPEFKYQDYVRNTYSQAYNTWQLADTPLSGVIIDTVDKGGRVGDQIYLQRYSATIRIRLPANSEAVTSASVRFVLMRLKTLSGSGSITSGEVWQDDNISSYINWDHRYNYTKLYDKTFSLTKGGVQERTIKISKNVRSKAQYVTNGQAVLKNQLILYVIGDENSIDENTTPYYAVTSRITYTDS